MRKFTIEREIEGVGGFDSGGDADLLLGEHDGSLFYYENTGSVAQAVFVSGRVRGVYLAGSSNVDTRSPSVADRDGDGDGDLVSAEATGSLFYFENTGNATSAAFVARTGTSNPFDGENGGGFSAPTAAELDGNGAPDLIAGDSDGGLGTYVVPEPGKGAMLSSGLLPLSVLARSRVRMRPTPSSG